MQTNDVFTRVLEHANRNINSLYRIPTYLIADLCAPIIDETRFASWNLF